MLILPSARPPSGSDESDVFAAVQNARVSFGVVPFENSSNGTVLYTVDLLIDRERIYGDVHVCGETFLPVHLCLLGYSNPSTPECGSQVLEVAASSAVDPASINSHAHPSRGLSHIQRILSHPQAFGQCEGFLSTYLKGIECQEVSSTSKAAEIAAGDLTRASAAIASGLAAGIYGLENLADGIQDREDNTTRFFILRKGPRPGGLTTLQHKPMSGVSWKTMVSFGIDHRLSGALADALLTFKTYDLNLTSINSRPSRLRLWHYIFLMEFEGRRESDGTGPVNNALEELGKTTLGWRWVGSWASIIVKDQKGA